MRSLVLAVALAACAPGVGRRIAARVGAAGAPAELVVIDVADGRVVAHAVVGRGAGAAVLPLSIVKLAAAAIWWAHGGGDAIDGTAIDDVLAQSLDRPGAALAIALRARLGGDAVVRELRGLGLTVALPAGADDARWGDALSIGERDLTTTVEGDARLVAAIGRGDLGAAATAKLERALRDGALRGTARAAAARLAGTGWTLGGKTGTGPASADPHDGVFAGLAFDPTGAPRYAIAVYVTGAGPGGGVAAALAADAVRELAR